MYLNLAWESLMSPKRQLTNVNKFSGRFYILGNSDSSLLPGELGMPVKRINSNLKRDSI